MGAFLCLQVIDPANQLKKKSTGKLPSAQKRVWLSPACFLAIGWFVDPSLMEIHLGMRQEQFNPCGSF